ncbi:MAG: hypothetical protein L3J82_09330 [Planctomycetes bacterium]|nr:hypothetical protein [Planctomycetota bacterium]
MSDLILSVTPASSGLFSFMVSITSDDPDDNPFTFTVQGLGSQQLSTLSVANGTTSVITGGAYVQPTTGSANMMVQETFTISNAAGAGDITLTLPIGISSETNCTATISTAPTGAVVAGGSSESFTLDITPSADGSYSFTVTIDSNDPDTPYTFTVHGFADSPSSGGGGGDDVESGCVVNAGGSTIILFLLILTAVALFRRCVKGSGSIFCEAKIGA